MKFIYKVGIDSRSTEIKFHVDTMIITDLIITDFTYNGQKKSGPSQLEWACLFIVSIIFSMGITQKPKIEICQSV